MVRPMASCTEARPYTLTPIARPEDLGWHRIAPSREVQVVDAAGRPLPAGRVGQVRIRFLEGVVSLQNAAAAKEFRVAIESGPTDRSELARGRARRCADRPRAFRRHLDTQRYG